MAETIQEQAYNTVLKKPDTHRLAVWRQTGKARLQGLPDLPYDGE